ncbi:MAG: DUF554 domain-containing protein [Lachnospiraceae bacterium]|nr:DUF554 domain-containing protein [Lachnospiraceae bacterium]MBR3769824.1 DUF554 domain-containing protein [Lachnospiraceae bacterium]
MIATIVNMVAVLIGGSVGLLLKKGLPEKLSDSIMKGLGLCTLYLGISGSLKGQNSLILIISMVVGIVIGEILDLDDKVNRLGKFVEKKFQKEGNTKVSIAEGFVSASLLFCVGAMAIVGSLQAGLAGDYEMLYNKSMLDGVAAIIFASSFGVGVLLSAFFVFAYQGTITLLAQWIAPFLTDVVIAEMTCVGSVIIIGIALNMIGLTKFKLMNYVPAVFIPIILCKFM